MPDPISKILGIIADVQNMKNSERSQGYVMTGGDHMIIAERIAQELGITEPKSSKKKSGD